MGDPIKKVTLKDGSVRYRFVIDAAPGADGKRKQVTKTFDGLKEAQKEYARIKHETATGSYVIPNKITVTEWLDEWLAEATVDVEAATARNYRDALLPVRERLGHRRIQTLSEKDVRELVAWMATSGRKIGGKKGTGLGARMIQLTLGRLRAALTVAVIRGVVVRNVALHTKIPKAAKDASKVRKAARPKPWNEAEVKQFLTAIREHRLYAVMLLSMLGLRPEEVCGLRWTNVDLEKGTLEVAIVRTMVAGEVVEKGAKTLAGERTLPLPTPALSALTAFKALQEKEKQEAGDAYADQGYVLVGQFGGEPWKTDKLRREAYKLMKLAGVRRVRPYDARHACLTYLATSGVPDVVVSAWAGHADLSFTKRTYIHPDPEDLRAAADQLDELLG